MVEAVNAGARLDRLPIGSFHRKVLWLVGLGMFFDSFDNNLSGSVLASMLDSKWSTLELNSLFMSVTFFGLATGAGLAGWLSDRYGRLFAYQFNLAIFGTLAFACAIAPTMHWLIPIRFFMSLGLGAEYVMGYGLIVEFVPPSQRGRYIGFMALIGGSGVFVTSLCSMAVIPVLGWRAMFLIGGVGTLFIWWLRRHLPESPRWLERVGRAEEADEILRRIEAEASRDAPLPPFVAVPFSEPRSVSAAVLFSRPVIHRTLIAIVLAITGLFGSFTLTGWMPTFFVSQGMTVTRSLGFSTAMMAGFIVGPLCCALIADRIGRRWGIVVFGVICATIAAIYPFMNQPAFVVGCGFLLVSMVAVYLTLALGSAPELFPTEYRFRGAGLAQTVGRAGLIALPFIVLALFRNYGIGGVIGAVSGMYVVVTLFMAVAGIETNQRSLEALEPDASPDGSPVGVSIPSAMAAGRAPVRAPS